MRAARGFRGLLLLLLLLLLLPKIVKVDELYRSLLPFSAAKTARLSLWVLVATHPNKALELSGDVNRVLDTRIERGL